MFNFPNRKASTFKTISKQVKSLHANLGMNFEKMINDTNSYYLKKGIAAIYKKPTPIQIVKVDFPARNKAKITEAYYKTPSTTDYNGIYKGRYIDFEAKETTIKTAFPLRYLYHHQVLHLQDITKLGGIGFILVHFTSSKETFLMPYTVLEEYWEIYQSGGRKSIPYQAFKDNCSLIPTSFTPLIDYLKVIDEVFL